MKRRLGSGPTFGRRRAVTASGVGIAGLALGGLGFVRSPPLIAQSIQLDGTPYAMPTPCVVPTIHRSPSAENEPTEDVTTGSSITFDGDSATITGRLAALLATCGTDIYALTIDANLANRLTDIRLLWQGVLQRHLCLLDAANVDLRCTDGDTGLAMNDLVLLEGTYYPRITGQPNPAASYTLKVDVTSEAVADPEAEPNDQLSLVTTMALEENGFINAGRLASNDGDFFRIPVSGEPQLWLIEVSGPTAAIKLLDVTGGALLSATTNGSTAQIYDTFLVPGDHLLYVSGEPGDYTVTATPLGPPDARLDLQLYPKTEVATDEPEITDEESHSGGLDFSTPDEIQRDASRCYSGDMAVLASPETAPTSTYFSLPLSSASSITPTTPRPRCKHYTLRARQSLPKISRSRWRVSIRATSVTRPWTASAAEMASTSSPASS